MLYAIFILIDNFSAVFWFPFTQSFAILDEINHQKLQKDKKILVGFIIKFDDGNSILFLG